MFYYITAYWPKLISAAWFAIFNLMMLYTYTGIKKHIPERLLSGFLLSPSFLSIIGEICTVSAYNYCVDNHIFTDDKDLIFIFFCFTMDAIVVFLGGMLFSKFTGMHDFQGAVVYMEYVCIERLCLVVATTYLGYVTLYFGFQAVLYIFHRKDMPFLFSGKEIKWKGIFLNLVGLFYILDTLYAAYFIFPELGTNIINIENLIWLDLVALISSGFVAAYMKMSISQAQEHDKKIDYFTKLMNSQEDIIITLAEISEAKSGETGQHVRRVAEYSRILAEKLNLPLYDVETIKIAAMMHDLGKLIISQEIVEKPGKLTPDEYEIIKGHAQYGWDILSRSKGDIIDMAKIIALQHHERWDGTGYPNGLREDEISIYAQIVSVADVFDALTTSRSYKEAWSNEDALAEIIRQKGMQFSPEVVNTFVACFDEIMVIQKTYQDD